MPRPAPSGHADVRPVPTATQTREETRDSSNEQARQVDGENDADASALQTNWRPPDLRPRHDPDQVARHGISVYTSKRLQLFTDITPGEAEQIPSLVDALFDEWQNYFGELPPSRDGSDFQLTGYLMRDQTAFRDAGLLPTNLPVFAHGKHDGQEFWMNEQEHPYYRRHLLFHEATHCFMQMMGGTTTDVPIWYLEGMAELFATHRLSEEGSPTFRVMPQTPDDQVGFGRIEMIHQDVHSGRALRLNDLTSLTPDQFQQRPSAYAWSWITCLLADRNPNYHDAFQELGRRYPSEGFADVYRELFDPLAADFAVEWLLLVPSLRYGSELNTLSIAFRDGQPISHVASASVLADRGWQSSGIAIDADSQYSIAATGETVLADQPDPWVSQPAGITVRYSRGEPVGRLMGIVIGPTPSAGSDGRFVGEVFPIGSSTMFSTTHPGTLYLRVNDFDDELADNTGRYEVLVRPETVETR